MDLSKGLDLSKFPSNSLKNWNVNEILGISTYLYLILEFLKRKEIYLLLFINKRWKFLILESNENASINIKYFRIFYNSIYLTDNLLDTKSNNSYCFGPGRIIVGPIHKNQTLTCNKIIISPVKLKFLPSVGLFNTYVATDLSFTIIPFHIVQEKSKIKSLAKEGKTFMFTNGYNDQYHRYNYYKNESDTWGNWYCVWYKKELQYEKYVWKISDEGIVFNGSHRKNIYEKCHEFYFIIEFDCGPCSLDELIDGINKRDEYLSSKNCINISVN